MPTVLVKDVLSRASNLLLDAAPQFHRHPQPIKLKPGTKQSIASIAAADCKPGDGSNPTAPVIGTQLLSLVRNMGAAGTTPGRAIRVQPRDALDTQDPDWHTKTGTVVRGFIADPATPHEFYVTPGVPAAGTTVWVEASYTAQPLRIPYADYSASNVTITIADEFIDDLVNYIVARANMKPVEWVDAAKAVAFASMFTSSLNAKVEALTGHNPNLKFLPFAPAPIGAAK